MTTRTATLDSTTALHQELNALLETAAHVACTRFGGSFLVVDRTGGADATDVKLHIAGVLVDLWELDPLLWDDAQWAGARAVRAGQARVVMPVLHRD